MEHFQYRITPSRFHRGTAKPTDLGFFIQPMLCVPSSMTFSSKLHRAQELASSVVCVGLDPDPDLFPDQFRDLPVADAVRRFCKSIIEATHEVVCAYKPNLAFFEALGRDGLGILEDVLGSIPPDRITIADGKRGDIGNTAGRYATAVFENLSFDACTVSPYMGRDAILPFLAWPEKAAFALVRTSNSSADEVQNLDVGGIPLYFRIAHLLATWSSGEPGEIGFVVGATDTRALADVRDRFPDVPLLIPGIGAQGGDPEAVMATTAGGTGPILVNSSRSILYAGKGVDFADRARDVTIRLRDDLNRGR